MKNYFERIFNGWLAVLLIYWLYLSMLLWLTVHSITIYADLGQRTRTDEFWLVFNLVFIYLGFVACRYVKRLFDNLFRLSHYPVAKILCSRHEPHYWAQVIGADDDFEDEETNND